MEFSLITPTLGDTVKVKRFLDSIERNANDKKNIEVLFAVDEGITEIQKFVGMQKYSFSVKFYERPKTDNFSDDYYNWLANRTTGRYIWACNDDMWFGTRHWDAKIQKKIRDSGWSVFLVDTKESTREVINKGFCCFPLISRKALIEIGFLFFPQIRVYPADKAVYMLFEKIGRIINAQDIIINSTYVSEETDSRRWKIYQEDVKNGALSIDMTKEVTSLLISGKDDPGPKRVGKIDRIINIIKE